MKVIVLKASHHGLRSPFKREQRLFSVDSPKAIKANDYVSDPMDRGSSHRRRLAPAMAREVAELADQLRRQGIKDPVRQAQNTLAKRWKFASGKALNRWLRRNR